MLCARGKMADTNACQLCTSPCNGYNMTIWCKTHPSLCHTCVTNFNNQRLTKFLAMEDRPVCPMCPPVTCNDGSRYYIPMCKSIAAQ